MNNRYRTAIITSVNKPLIAEWKALWERSEHATVFNSYEWFNAYMHISKNKKYEVHVCYEGEKLVAILPLQLYTVYGISAWGVLCPERHGDTPFLMEEYTKPLSKSFFDSVFANRAVFLQKMDEQAAKVLHSLYPSMLISIMSVNPTISLIGDPFMSASQNMVKQVRKLIKKYEGQIKFTSYHTDLSKHFSDILALQKSTSKAAKSMDIFKNPENKAYYKTLIDHCSQFVWISFLYFDNKPITYEYGLQYKDHYFGEQIAFHNDYKKYSPGKIMVFKLIDMWKNKGLSSIDQGGGISNYKMQFTNSYRILYNAYYSQNAFIMLWWKLVNNARRINQIAFPKKNTNDHKFLFKTI